MLVLVVVVVMDKRFLAVLTALVHVGRELGLREGDSLPCKSYSVSANKTDLANKKIHREQLTKVILFPASHTVLLQTRLIGKRKIYREQLMKVILFPAKAYSASANRLIWQTKKYIGNS